jgi:membrane protein implicated in regulation of membrane protease activity
MSPQQKDIGESVNVTEWDNAGHAQVKHRGALWAATTVEGSVSGLTPEPGIYLIHDIQGNTLVLRKK